MLIKPWCMCEGYGYVCVCVCVCVSVCLSVTVLAATYLVYMSKVRQHTVSCIVWTSLKTFPLGDMELFACHDDQRLGSFSTKKHTNSS